MIIGFKQMDDASAGENPPNWQEGDTIWSWQYTGSESLKEWTTLAGTTVKSSDDDFEILASDKDGKGKRGISKALAATGLSDKVILLEADVCYENVEKLNKSGGGTFFLTVNGRSHWSCVKKMDGSIPWRTISFAARLPKVVDDLKVELRFNDASGTVKVRKVQASVLKVPGAFLEKWKTLKDPDSYKQTAKYRGVMISTSRLKEEGCQFLAEKWNANLVRWQLGWWGMKVDGKRKEQVIKEYDEWLRKKLQGLDQGLKWCEKYGIKVVVDLHVTPGGRDPLNSGTMRIFTDKDYAEFYLRTWQTIAKRYKANKSIWGYDIVNEPVLRARALPGQDWESLAERTVKEIRKIDPGRMIIIEPEEMAAVRGLEYLKPLNCDNIVYSFHMYEPYHYTHQGIYGMPANIAYPGNSDGEFWNREQVKNRMTVVRKFQQVYKVPIYVGEFSVVRWANNGDKYLKDCLDTFAEFGWDWSYHAFREWHGWSVEHNDDPKNIKPVKEVTPRQKVLRQGFAANRMN
jgi:hypothetical protein